MSAPMTALLARTVRISTRGAATHFARMLLGSLVLLTLATTATLSAMFGAAGLHLLANIVWWSAGFITLLGIGLFCSAITEEKEEQTIGLLRMAGLRPLAILLAKSTARFYDAVMLFAILMPFALLAVTLGGVSVMQVLACAIALAAYTFLLANMGLLMSVLRPTTTAASGLMALLLIVTHLVPWLFWSNPLGRILSESSIWHSLTVILSTGYSGGLVSLQTWTNVGGGVLFFVLSLLLFERCVHDDESQAPERQTVRANSRLRLFGMSRPTSGIAAVVWKDFHFGCGGRLMLLIKPLVLFAMIGTVLYFSHRFDSYFEWTHIGVTAQFIALLWLVLEFALHLSRLFAQEVRWQTLTGLLSLPYSAGQLAYAKVRSALLAMLPTCGVLGLGIVLAPQEFFHGADSFLTSFAGWTTLAMVVFFWHTCAYLSLILRRSPFIAAIGVVLGIQFVFWMLISLFVFALFSRGGGGSGMEAIQALQLVFFAVASFYMHVSVARRLVIKGAV